MEYKVQITYKRIKNLHLRVKVDTVVVSAPFGVKEKVIQDFIRRNIDFINKQMEVQAYKQNQNAINYHDKIMLLNKEYEILEITSKPKVTEHFIFLNEKYELKSQIKVLFKTQLYEYMLLLTKKYFHWMFQDVNFPKIVIKDVKSKWGSYNKRKHEIIYSSELLFKDMATYDYIVVHELAHIIQFDHSKKFYEIVIKYCPNYKKLRAMLKG